MPLDLVFQEDGADRFPHSHGLKRYSAEVIVDRFEPGRRQWNLDRVVYSAKDNKEFSLRFGFQDDDRHGVGAGQFFEVWCTKLPTTREMRAHEACSGPKHYPLDRPDDPNATDIALSPDNDVVQLVLGTRRYESAIEFHDVDHSLPPVPPIFHKAGRRSRERSKPWELGRHLHGLVK